MNTKISLAALFFLAMLCGPSGASQGRERPATPQAQQSPATTVATTSGDADRADGAASGVVAGLREQNQLIRQQQDQLLNVVLWSLTGVVTITILLAGFSWFTNFKFYSADKRALRQELDQKLSQAGSSVEALIALARAETLSQMSENLNSFLEKSNNRLDELTARVNSEAEKMRGDLSGFSDKLTEVRKDMYAITGEIRVVEEEVWRVKDIPQNVLLTQAQRVEALVKAGKAEGVAYALSCMIETLNDEILAKGIGCNKATIDATVKRVKLAAEMDPKNTNLILEGIARIPIRD